MPAPSSLVPVLIPAYEPEPALLSTVAALHELGFSRIVVVNDGSGPAFDPVFRQLLHSYPCVRLLRHSVNLGKGAALKTGLNQVLLDFPDAPGAVTADADGQHLPDDIARVAATLAQTNGSALVLGARHFDTHVPLRSLAGNRISSVALRLVVGESLHDTQTGLRGIPAALIPQLLQLPATGYEFELDMLLAAKHGGLPLLEVPIQTVYLAGNASSHFNPLWDSMRIYFVLLRFTLASLITALIDNAVFILMFTSSSHILASQLVGRAAAVLFNYTAARRAVFQARDRHRETLPKFLALVAVNTLLSYGIITWLHSVRGVRVIVAKICVEGILFLANFAIQRDFVFTRKPA